ncbi:eukaryotic translation initiation factor 3 subunit E, partial [Coemansia helicoidea]
LIRDTRMDAKVDFKANAIVMNPPYNPVYQQVIERTKALVFRSQVLNGAIDKRGSAADKKDAKKQDPKQKRGQQRPARRPADNAVAA